MTITRAEAASRFQLPGREFTALVSPSRGSSDLCAWRLTVDPGFTSPDSHTLDREEIFMITRGALRLSDGGDVVGVGDVAVVPAGSPIQISNAGDDIAEALVTVTAGFSATTADGTVVGAPPWAL